MMERLMITIDLYRIMDSKIQMRSSTAILSFKLKKIEERPRTNAIPC
jgi:hypothetical protein